MTTNRVKSVFVILTVVQLLAAPSLVVHAAAPSACPDPYEPNDTFAQARYLDPGTIDSYICTTSDLDYFVFPVYAGGRIKAELSQLPANYNLCLYGLNEIEIACSKNSGTEVETIDEVATVDGHYYLLVSGAKGAYDAKQPYRLTVKYPEIDLVITDAWPEGDDICYQIRNIGTAATSQGHVTHLSIDNTPTTSDAVGVGLAPGERLNRCFGITWQCSQLSDAIRLLADNDDWVYESDETNNTLEETWLCDTAPPHITSGPTVSSITQDSATISWTTDEQADSRVQLGRYASLFADEVVDSTKTTDHAIVLTNLQQGTTYHFQVLSTDDSGNSAASNDLFFQTQPPFDSTEPAISFFEATGRRLPLEYTAEVSDDVGVERVEFFFDDQLFEIDYSAPFRSLLDPMELGMDPEGFFQLHNFQATAFDLYDNASINRYTSAGAEVFEDCATYGASVDFNEPYSGFAIATTGTRAPSGEVLIEVDSRQSPLIPLAQDGFEHPGADGHREDMEWSVMEPVEFRMDGSELPTTSVEGDPDHPTVLRYTFDPAGLEVGWHWLSARAHTNLGCLVGDFVEIVVEGPPELEFERTVTLRDTYLDVELTVTNVGDSPAYLYRIRDTLVGLQAAAAPSSTNVRFSYLTGERQSVAEWFSGGEGARVGIGSSLTFEYRAVPILYTSDVTYQIGGSGNVSYHVGDEVFDQDIPLTSAWVEVPGEALDLTVDEAVERAIAAADFLLVTNPYHLFALNDAEDVNELLAKAAELASLPERTGVLAYFNGYHVIHTGFRAGDRVASGENHYGDATDDEIVVGSLPFDEIGIYNLDETLGTGYEHPDYSRELSEGDSLALGNVQARDGVGGVHARAEILVADDDDGRVWSLLWHEPAGAWLYSYLYVGYDTGDSMAAGDVLLSSSPPDQEEIVVVYEIPDSLGEVQIFADWVDVAAESFYAPYEEGDGFAVGDVVPDYLDEIVIADVSAGSIWIYDRDFFLGWDRAYTISGLELAAEDELALGDIWGDNREEIVLADESEDRIYVYGYDADDDRFESISDFGYPFQVGDGLAVGDVLNPGKAEILVARGTSTGVRNWGDVEVVSFFPGEQPGDRLALDELINEHGRWAEQLDASWVDDGLDDSWVDDGHLLIVGENEIIPAFSFVWGLELTDLGQVDYGDREYGSTYGDENGQELAVGRMIGDLASQLVDPIQTSIDIVQGTESFDTSDAYCASGHPCGASGSAPCLYDFDDTAATMDTRLTSQGFSVLRRDLPSETQFFDDARDKDVLFLAAHGSRTSWDIITSGMVYDDFHPGEARPLVVAAACLTGRYPGEQGIAEAFLDRGASAYIGATESAFGPWNEYLLETFFCYLDLSRTVGSALKAAKNQRVLADCRRRETAWNLYNIAIHQLYGDPKLQLSSPAASAAGDRTPAAPSVEVSSLTTSLSSIQVSIPDYEVTTLEGWDQVEIPGGDMLLITGEPMVPIFYASASFPKGTQIQDVVLSQRGSMSSDTGLNIPVVVPAEYGLSPIDVVAEGVEDWWPDADFDWTTRRGPDDTLLLEITIFPFYYNPTTTNARFYQGYTFEVETTTSEVEIAGIFLDRHTYSPGKTVHAEVFVRAPDDTPRDLVVDATVRSEAQDEIVAGFPLRTLKEVRGLASFSLDWDSTGFDGGVYVLELSIRDEEGTLQASDLRSFRLGITAGQITRLTAGPDPFHIGDSIDMTMVFENVGTEVISGTAVLRVRDEAGATLQESSFEVSNLESGQEIRVDDVWDTAGVERGSYTIVGYVSYGGTLAGPTSALVETWHRTYMPLISKQSGG